MYYRIGLLYCEREHGIYSHIPFASPATTDLNEAQKTFDFLLKQWTNNWRGNKLIREHTREKDFACYIREALVECNEAAYIHGYYLLQLQAFNYNVDD